MKRLLAMFLAVVMLVTNCPVTAFATDTEILESGNFRYQILSDETASICGYTGKAKEGTVHLKVPDSIDGIPVPKLS